MQLFEVKTAAMRVTAFTGNYGSGKTEVAVNFCLLAAERETGLRIADLDIVNPYFRCREATELMEAHGIEVIAPRDGLRHADLPIILPEIKGMIEKGRGRTVLDVGGDPVGARVLSSLAGSFDVGELDVVVVLNARRPFTDTVGGCLKMIRDIEEASRLDATALVGNTHLMESTTPGIVLEGEALVAEVSRQVGLPVRFLTVDPAVLERWSGPEPSVPVLPLTRHMSPPWVPKPRHEARVLKA
jgi:hypothetical protein